MDVPGQTEAVFGLSTYVSKKRNPVALVRGGTDNRTFVHYKIDGISVYQSSHECLLRNLRHEKKSCYFLGKTPAHDEVIAALKKSPDAGETHSLFRLAVSIRGAVHDAPTAEIEFGQFLGSEVSVAVPFPRTIGSGAFLVAASTPDGPLDVFSHRDAPSSGPRASSLTPGDTDRTSIDLVNNRGQRYPSTLMNLIKVNSVGSIEPYGAVTLSFSAPAIELDPNNLAPTADAGPDRVLFTNKDSVSVGLNGQASVDVEDDPLAFEWSGQFGTALGPQAIVDLPVGVHNVTLSVTDANGGVGVDNLTVDIRQGGKCALDVDHDGRVSAATDGVYIFRYLLGLESVVPTEFRTLGVFIPPDWEIVASISEIHDTLDIDSDDTIRATTDGVYLFRNLLGLESDVPGVFRRLDSTIPSNDEIKARIESLCPAASW